MKRHTEKQMRKLYAEWQESGKSKKEFALEKDIISTTFYYWIKKFRKKDLPAHPNLKKKGFVPLAIGDSFSKESKQAVVRINYPSGICIDFFQTPDAGLLKTLIG